MLHLLDAVGAVEAGEGSLGGLTVGDHIGDAGGDAEVIFEDTEAVGGFRLKAGMIRAAEGPE